ncbi:hypothetical protein ACFVFJ_48230 [Streptomyces sp. NPDC057717]|uniref:hypothetical protein n=1 Tax=Streptomyces sp. NPDC057717 TaxID=3346224 RepID=UPI003693C6C2
MTDLRLGQLFTGTRLRFGQLGQVPRLIELLEWGRFHSGRLQLLLVDELVPDVRSRPASTGMEAGQATSSMVGGFAKEEESDSTLLSTARANVS